MLLVLLLRSAPMLLRPTTAPKSFRSCMTFKLISLLSYAWGVEDIVLGLSFQVETTTTGPKRTSKSSLSVLHFFWPTGWPPDGGMLPRMVKFRARRAQSPALPFAVLEPLQRLQSPPSTSRSDGTASPNRYENTGCLPGLESSYDHVRRSHAWSSR